MVRAAALPPGWLAAGAHRLADKARSDHRLSRLFGAWRSTTARLEDRRLGIRTERVVTPRAATAHADAHIHVPLAYGQARRVLRALGVRSGDVLADVGCGLGRVVALGARTPATRAIGIECDPTMASMARRNLETLRGRRAQVEILTSDAATASYHAVTCLVLFNPFGPGTMRDMLAQLRSSLVAHPRPVRIAYISPTAEAELERCEWLRRTGVARSFWYRHKVSYWETIS